MAFGDLSRHSKRSAIPGRTAAPAAAFRNRRFQDSSWFGPCGTEGVVAGLTVLWGCGGGLPATRQELVNTALGPARREFAQHVREVSKGRDTLQRARPGEAIEYRRPLRRTMRAEEEKIVPAQGDRPQLLFAQIVVQLETPILEEAGECRPLIDHVCRRLGEVRSRGLTALGGRQPTPELFEYRALAGAPPARRARAPWHPPDAR